MRTRIGSLFEFSIFLIFILLILFLVLICVPFSGFGIGSMIKSGLQFGEFFELDFRSPCINILQRLLPILHLTFTFAQLYFVFLNSKVSTFFYLPLEISSEIINLQLLHFAPLTFFFFLHFTRKGKFDCL